MKQAIIIGIFGVVLAGSALGNSFTGTVTDVIDGDTCILQVQDAGVRIQESGISPGLPIRVRLAEIDAPEKNQPFGAEAKEALSAKILGKTVVVGWGKRGRYGRIIGRIFLNSRLRQTTTPRQGRSQRTPRDRRGAGKAQNGRGERSVNRELVEEGIAWVYRSYCDDPAMLNAETLARNSRLGLWHNTSPTPPWNYRKRQKRK